MSTPELEELYAYYCRTDSDICLHLPYLRALASEAITIVELGVRTGLSTTAFLCGLDRKLDIGTTRLISCDVVRLPEVNELVRFANSTDTSFTFLERDSRLALPMPPVPSPWDVLFIDTRHIEEQLTVELSVHGEAVSQNGLIVLHDTETFWENGEVSGHKGLRCAVERFLSERRDWRIVRKVDYCNGLLTLQRG